MEDKVVWFFFSNFGGQNAREFFFSLIYDEIDMEDFFSTFKSQNRDGGFLKFFIWGAEIMEGNFSPTGDENQGRKLISV